MIKNTSLIVIILSCLTFLSHAKGSTSIVILGDSLSASYGMKQNEGWVSLLNSQLAQQKAPYTIVNASISGETTAGGLSRLPGILSNQKVDYLLIELGGNDGLRGFPPALIKNNLLQLINLAKKENIPVFLMKIRIPPNYGPRYNKLFMEVFDQAAEETGIVALPFFMEDIATESHLMQADGIHPNIKAQPLIAEFMKELLTTIVEP